MVIWVMLYTSPGSSNIDLLLKLLRKVYSLIVFHLFHDLCSINSVVTYLIYTIGMLYGIKKMS